MRYLNTNNDYAAISINTAVLLTFCAVPGVTTRLDRKRRQSTTFIMDGGGPGGGGQGGGGQGGGGQGGGGLGGGGQGGGG